MNVSHVVELEDGSVEFKGNLKPNEVEFLVEFAINHLLAIGAIPFIKEEGQQLNLDFGTDTVQ